MSREIKFRGMSLTGKWFTGDLAQPKNDISTNVKAGGFFISNEYGMPHAYAVRPETVGQYTGLKDKNGVEIYEGDVVRSFSNINKVSDPHLSNAEATYRTTFVEFYNGAFRLSSDEYPHGCGILNNYVGAMAKDIEVIGNIYENPELLQPAATTNEIQGE